jgi:hypothetical protein
MRIGQRLQRVSLTQHFVFGFFALDLLDTPAAYQIR